MCWAREGLVVVGALLRVIFHCRQPSYRRGLLDSPVITILVSAAIASIRQQVLWI